MNKKIIFVSASLVLLAASCSSKTAVNTETIPTPTPAAQQMSMKDLMVAGKAQQCTFNASENGSQSQGTVYVSGGKMHGDFTSTVNGKATVSHMINDGTTVYTWVDGMAMAMKMSVSAMANTQTATSTTSAHATVDPNAKYNYNCSGWSVDNAMFTPPSGINFTDESQMMMQMNSGKQGASAGASASATLKVQECAACNNAGAGKAQCLAALHC